MTDHVKDQLCQRIEELEAEKMELNEQLDIAQQERDEWKAQAEGEAVVCGSYRDERDALAELLEEAKDWEGLVYQYQAERDELAALVGRLKEEEK